MEKERVSAVVVVEVEEDGVWDGFVWCIKVLS